MYPRDALGGQVLQLGMKAVDSPAVGEDAFAAQGVDEQAEAIF